MDYAAFLTAVGRGAVPPLCLLHGTEPLLLDDALARLTEAWAADPALVALNREGFDARETDAETIVRSALTLPFLAPARLVVVRESQELDPRGQRVLGEYAKAPNPSTCLVFSASELLQATHWLLKLIPPEAVVLVRPPAARELPEWLKRRAAAQGIVLADEAAQLLVRLVGEDLGALVRELEKAALWAGSAGGEIGVDAVNAVVGAHRLRSIFDLTRALERRAFGPALALLEALLDSGEEPLGVVGMLAREVRLTWLAKEWLRQGKSPEEIARLLRRPAPDAFLSRAEACSAAALKRQLSRCWEVERRLKAGGLARPELAALLADLCEAG